MLKLIKVLVQTTQMTNLLPLLTLIGENPAHTAATIDTTYSVVEEWTNISEEPRAKQVTLASL